LSYDQIENKMFNDLLGERLGYFKYFLNSQLEIMFSNSSKILITIFPYFPKLHHSEFFYYFFLSITKAYLLELNKIGS